MTKEVVAVGKGAIVVEELVTTGSRVVAASKMVAEASDLEGDIGAVSEDHAAVGRAVSGGEWFTTMSRWTKEKGKLSHQK